MRKYSPEYEARISNLYRAICGVTTRFEFTHPVEAADIATVRQALADVLQDDCDASLEPEPGGRGVKVVVRLDGVPVYGRRMTVDGAP